MPRYRGRRLRLARTDCWLKCTTAGKALSDGIQSILPEEFAGTL